MTASPRLQALATRMAFFVVGIGIAAWAPLVPITKVRLSLDDAQLGTLLLFLGLGSILAMPFSGHLAAKFGCRRVITSFVLVGSLALPLLALAPNPLVLGAALFVYGACAGCTDVTMNIQASLVEKAAARPMMSGFHGFYSLGSIVGSAFMTAMLTGGIRPWQAIVAVALICVTGVVATRRGLLADATPDEPSPIFIVPRGRVLLIGMMCFVLFMSEGSVLDWSGIVLSSLKGVHPDRSGIGFVAFAVAMTAGRLSGDFLSRHSTPRQTVLIGSLCAALGFLTAILAPGAGLAVAGFALIGLGASNVVPVLFSAAGRQRQMPPHLALASITTLGYAGILAGPAIIGFLAHATSLPIALTFLITLLTLVAVFSARATTDETV